MLNKTNLSSQKDLLFEELILLKALIAFKDVWVFQ